MPGQRNKNGAGGINGMAKLLALHERESAPLINLFIVKKSSQNEGDPNDPLHSSIIFKNPRGQKLFLKKVREFFDFVVIFSSMTN